MMKAIETRVEARQRPEAMQQLRAFVEAWRDLHASLQPRTFGLDCVSVPIPEFTLEGPKAVKLYDLLSSVCETV